jgi:hypothetical protein
MLAGPLLFPLATCAAGAWTPSCAWAGGSMKARVLPGAAADQSSDVLRSRVRRRQLDAVVRVGGSQGRKLPGCLPRPCAPSWGRRARLLRARAQETCAQGAGREGGARRAGVPAGGRPAARGRGPEPAGGGDADERARPHASRLAQLAHQHRVPALNPTPSTGATVTRHLTAAPESGRTLCAALVPHVLLARRSNSSLVRRNGVAHCARSLGACLGPPALRPARAPCLSGGRSAGRGRGAARPVLRARAGAPRMGYRVTAR